jgi:hypothetical protein
MIDKWIVVKGKVRPINRPLLRRVLQCQFRCTALQRTSLPAERVCERRLKIQT